MMSRPSKSLRGGRAVAVLGIAAAVLSLNAGPAIAGPPANSQDRLVGTWAVQVTLRDCTTNAPLGPSFPSLVTFHGDGTISENPGSLAFAIGQRTSGHGIWIPKKKHTYVQEVVALILFDSAPNLPGPGFNPSLPVSPGFAAGWQTVTHEVAFEDADHLTSVGTNAFYNAAGDVYRFGCSTARGERFGAGTN